MSDSKVFIGEVGEVKFMGCCPDLSSLPGGCIPNHVDKEVLKEADSQLLSSSQFTSC